MNKKFLAILVLLSVIPGCVWGPRYQCNPPCGEPRTTCVEATDCYQEAPATTCYEDYSTTTSVVGQEVCHEATPGSDDNVEYCYEASDYPETTSQYPTEEYSYEGESSDEATQDFQGFEQEFDYDGFYE